MSAPRPAMFGTLSLRPNSLTQYVCIGWSGMTHSHLRMNYHMSTISQSNESDCSSDSGIAIADELPSVVLVSSDMMQSVRISDVVAASGGRAVSLDVRDALETVDRLQPVLILIDLGSDGDWRQLIRRSKLRPHTRHIPIYAYGSHVDASTLRAAREAGADHAWARSRMADELVQVVQRYVNPPVRHPDGWDDDVSDLARAGIEEFNRGDYFEQHELLEAAWLAEQRPIREMYQGILQVGLACYQIERGSWTGAMKMLGRGLPKLCDLPEVCQGIQIGDLRTQAERIRRDLTSLGPDRLYEFDKDRFPKIKLDSPAQ